MPTQLSAAERDHLAKILSLLGSNHDGEIIAAGRAAQQYLTKHRATWADVLAPGEPDRSSGHADARPIPWPALLGLFPDNWRECARMCRRAEISDRDRQFIVSISSYENHPSPKQINWLRDIIERLAQQQEDRP